MKTHIIVISLGLLCACSGDPVEKQTSAPVPIKNIVRAIDERMQFLGERYGVEAKVVLNLVMDYQRLMYGYAFIEVDYDPASADKRSVTKTFDAETTVRMLSEKYGISESKIVNILSDEEAYRTLENNRREQAQIERIQRKIEKLNGK